MTEISIVQQQNPFLAARSCTLCKNHLPFSPSPILQGCAQSRILIIGQAPGLLAHRSHTPWNDPSGDRLRLWLGVSRQQFYDEEKIALIPMGFCFPGSGPSGDLPPRPECAPTWHQVLTEAMQVKLTLLIGQYAQQYYLKNKMTVTERVKNWQTYQPETFVLPHPSPRNNRWLKKNSWFEAQVVPHMRQAIAHILQD